MKSIRIGAVALWVVIIARPVGAQAILAEPFVGIGTGPTATVGATLWWVGTDVLGFRASAAWLNDRSGDSVNGVVGSGGFVFAAPIAGGPPVRPFLALDFGLGKISNSNAFLFLRPAIGVTVRPGGRLSYLVESGVSLNHTRSDEWSLLAGVMFALAPSERRRQPAHGL